MSGPDTTSSYMLKPGDDIGTYRVVRPLGAGGMGEVYLVEHVHLRKRYALKILPPDISSDENFIDRFRIEARVMADLEHPGIVRVHNFGEDKGRHFLVMDYVEGPDGSPRTLEDELSWGKRLPEHVVHDMAIQLCDALEYAHSFPQSPVIHRDLKPGNILIYKPGLKTSASGVKPLAATTSELRVKIADFGLAKIVGTEYIRAVIDRSTTLTAVPVRPPKTEEMTTQINSTVGSSAPLLGTYDYMSPEQKTGAPVDARSDIYALGLILYRMLTGHRPEGTYEAPSKSGCRRRWDAIIARCLKRELELRYQDAGQLRRDLLALGAPRHKHPAFLAAAAGVGVLLFGAVLYGVWSRPAQQAEELVIIPIARGDDHLLLAFKIDVEPTGATLRVSQKKNIIAEATLNRERGTKIHLKPGIYTFELNRPGYRSVIQEVPVGPEHADTWAVSMIEAFGYLHVRQPEGDQLEILDGTGQKVAVGPPQKQGLMLVYKLPVGKYDVVVTRADHEPFTFKATIMENAPVDLKASFKPMPGSVMIAADPAVEIWENGVQLGRAGKWIHKVPAGVHNIQLRREGYRNAEMTVVVPANQEVTRPAPVMELQSATLTVSLDVRGASKIDAQYQPRTGRIRLGEREPQNVEFPWTIELNDVNKSLPIEVFVPGYRTTAPEAIRLSDAEHRRISVRVTALPVQVTILSEVPADVFRFRGDQPAKGLRRLVMGKDVPIGKTGTPFAIEAFELYKLTVMADGYQPAVVEVHSTSPGSTNEPIQVDLELTPVEEAAAKPQP